MASFLSLTIDRRMPTILLAIFIPGSFYRTVIIITLYSEVL